MNDEKPYVELHGRRYPLIGPGDFNMGDLCDCENAFGASFGTDAMDARKLASVLYISVRRVNPSVKIDDVRALTATQLAAVSSELERWMQEDDASPPDRPPDSGDDVSASNGSSGSSSEDASESQASLPSPIGSPD